MVYFLLLTYFSDFLLAFLCTKPPAENGFTPNGSKFFPFSVESFSEGGQNKFDSCLPFKRVDSLKGIYSIIFDITTTQFAFQNYWKKMCSKMSVINGTLEDFMR